MQPSPAITTYSRLLQLGSAGMADVHLALASRRAEFQRLVVVKTIRQQASQGAEARALILEEARLSARLNHPNVVRVTEIVELDRGAMLVMEYLDGLCLADALQNAGDAFTTPLRIRAVCEALAGLHHAHRLADFDGRPLGIVHRDVSPQNIFLTYDGCVKLLDFGIAKADDSENATRTGILKGRIAYMAAEQLRGEVLDCRADVYAMGCVLFEALAKRRLWGGVAQGEIVRAVAEGRIPRLDESFDTELRAIVDRAMAHSREQRFSTAEEMRLALERYLESLAEAGQVFSRDIGDMLAATCGERREQRQHEIAAAIQRIDRERSEAVTPVVPPPPQRMHIDVPKAAGIPQGLDQPSVGEPSRRRPDNEQDHVSGSRTGTGLWQTEAHGSSPKGRGLSWGAYALSGVLLIAAAAAAAPRLMRPTDTRSVPAAEAPTTLNRFVVEVEPPTATIFLDGEELGVGQVSSQLPDRSEHVLRVVHEGYEAVERAFVSEGDVKLEIELSPSREGNSAAGPSQRSADDSAERSADDSAEPSAPEGSKPSAQQRSSSSSSTARGRASNTAPITTSRAPATGGSEGTNCQPPYYYSGGVKTYKPECI